MPAPGLVNLGFLRLRFSNNFAVGSCGVGCPKIVFALGARPKTEPQAIQMQKKRQEAFKIKKNNGNGAKRVAKGASGARRYQNGAKRKQNGTKRQQNGTKSYQHGATGCQKGTERRLLDAFWSPFGSLLASCSSMLLTFGSILVSFGSILVSFGSILIPSGSAGSFCHPFRSIFVAFLNFESFLTIFLHLDCVRFRFWSRSQCK